MRQSALVALVAILPGCCIPVGAKDEEEECATPRECAEAEGDADTDTDADTDDDGCDAEFTITLPNGSEAALDCTGFTAEASFEFDPDNAPEVRTLNLELGSGESSGFECHVTLAITGVCGSGWYAVGGGSSASVATLDCPDVGDAYEGEFNMSEGTIHLSAISAGTEHGNLTGEPVPLHTEGSFYGEGSGVSIAGSFTITTTILGIDAEEAGCNVIETDPALDDADGDGFDGEDVGGRDCDDSDADVYPGAYDLPNDGVDGDCDGEDRSFDGVVVLEGESVTEEYEETVEGSLGLDVALLLDTTCSMSSYLGTLDVSDIASAARLEGDARYSFSTYDDYFYSTFGTSGDLPFDLVVQSTSDQARVQTGIDATVIHSGGDSPESGMEALYQLLTGAGYDQDCDARLDALTDVPPFVSAASDPFGGAVTGTYNSAVVGTGPNGGVGFRRGGVPVVVMITDNYLRDPDSSNATFNPSPGGCPLDAGATSVAAAATDLDAWIVGIEVGGVVAEPQFIALARAIGRLVDTDGDGSADDAPEYTATASTLNTVIAGALDDVGAEAVSSGYDEVEVVVTSDPFGVVREVRPAVFTGVEPDDVLTFDVIFEGIATGGDAVSTFVEISLVGDGSIFDSVTIAVEVAPR